MTNAVSRRQLALLLLTLLTAEAALLAPTPARNSRRSRAIRAAEPETEERPLTAEIDFITPNPEILDVVRPVVPSSHGLTWPTFEGRPEPTRDPGLEVLSEAHRRPEGSLLASVASSSRNYMATFSSAQERFAPAAKKEPGQIVRAC